MHNHSITILEARLARIRNLSVGIDIHPDMSEFERAAYRKRAKSIEKRIRRKITTLQFAEADTRRELIYRAAENIAQAASPTLILRTQEIIQSNYRTEPAPFEGAYE